ncbi:MAG: phosphotransferase family protein [Chloroflexia bacterium]
MARSDLPDASIDSEPQALTTEEQLLLSELARHAVGARVEVAGSKVLKRQVDYLVLLVNMRHPTLRVTVKLAGPLAALPCPFERTAALLRRVLAETTVPVPEVLAADTSYRAWPWRYMVKTYMPGREWATVRRRLREEESARVHREMGRAVAQLHGMAFQGFGELSDDGTLQTGRPYLDALAERARRRIHDPRHAELFISVLKDKAGLFRDVSPGQAGLCHEDLHGHNIICQRRDGSWRLAAVLDFDSAWAGHQESDLARLEFWRGMAGEGFWEAYKEVRPIAETYPQRRLIHQLMWCLEYGPSSEEHIEDTRRVCAALGVAPPGGFAWPTNSALFG